MYARARQFFVGWGLRSQRRNGKHDHRRSDPLRRLRLESLEDRCLLSISPPVASGAALLGAPNSIQQATGDTPPTAADLAWKNQNMIDTQQVRLNQLGLDRVNASRISSGHAALSPATTSVAAMGDEVVGSTLAQLAVLPSTSLAGIASPMAANSPLGLPSSVDNSQTNWFPEIRTQLAGSCVSYATTYYAATYMTAMARGWNETNPDNSDKLSPAWTYNLVNGGADNGSNIYANYQVLLDNGAATWQEDPDDGSFKSWVYNDPSVWRDAINYRMNQSGYIENVNTDDGTALQQVKTMLTDGYVLNFGTYIGSWQYTTLQSNAAAPGNAAYVGQQACSWLNGTAGGHAMTIVGYNDNLWIDVNGNGQVDAGEKGAFLVANSWGNSWGNNGFIWLSYDAMKPTSGVVGGPSSGRVAAFQGNSEIDWITARPSYTPSLLASFTVQEAEREKMAIFVGSGPAGSTTPTQTWQSISLDYNGGSLRDGGPATAAELNGLQSVALDSAGDLFIADTNNSRIREVNYATGVITTVAGNGWFSYGGDGGQATDAALNGPAGGALDSAGDLLFIGDTGNNVVREVNLTTGVITTVAGNGTGGYSGDNGPATAAELSNPAGLALDSAGDLFITDWSNSRIREMNYTTGIITTVAGNGTGGYRGDNGKATAAELYYPYAVVLDSTGDLFIADAGNNRIREVNTAGVISTVAGNGTVGYSGDNGKATAAELDNSSGIALDSVGDLFIADQGNVRIREVNHTTRMITTVAGNGSWGYTGDNGKATAAELDAPAGIALDGAGNLFIADASNNRVRKIDHATGLITIAAGGGELGFDGQSYSGNPSAAPAGQFVLDLTDLLPNINTNQNSSYFLGLTDTAQSSVLGGTITSFQIVESNGTVLGTCPSGAASGDVPQSSYGGSTAYAFFTPPLVTGVGPLVTGVGSATGPVAGGTTVTIAGMNLAGATVDFGSTAATIISDTSTQITVSDPAGTVGTVDVTVTTAAGRSSLSTADRFTYLPTATITTLAVSPSLPAAYGTQLTFTATVASGSGSPTGGTVTFLNGNSTLGTASLVSGVARLQVSTLAPGTDLVTASYSGYGYFGGSSTVLEPNSAITTVAGGVSPGDGGAATAAEVNGPQGVAFDSAGNLFIADTRNSRIREVNHVTGIITTVAGTGTAGYSGDYRQATAAELDNATGVAVDTAGNLFIADSGNNVVREVNHATGVITTLAGNGTQDYGGDNGQAIAAELANPTGVALDSAGDLFIADFWNNRIREVNLSTGVITTVAGNSPGGYSGDNGQATAAELWGTRGVAVDATGDLFIADAGNCVVREVNHATGVITTVAGNGTWGYSGDKGKATAAVLANSSGVALDSAGDLFIADQGNARIREVNHTTGVITTVAGNGTWGYNGDNGRATAAELDAPAGVAVDGAGNLFIADASNNRIRKVNHATGVITTAAGGVSPGDGGPATAAEVNGPQSVALDSAGNLFIADTNNTRIREVNHVTGVITTVAGSGSSGYGGDNGQATAAELSNPAGVALDSAGDLFIADTGNCVIREVNRATGVITTVAGNGIWGYSGDNGQATAAELSNPAGLALDSAGDLFITDWSNSRIREMNHATGIITTVAGNGTGGYSGDNGKATAAELYYPYSVALDSTGDLFIADAGNNRIREVNLSTGIITTAAGGVIAGDNGPATAAELSNPSGVALDSTGDLFIADQGNARIREVNRATGVITTVAGNGTSGYRGDNGQATTAELNAPAGVAVDSEGDLVIADSSNNRIREVASGATVVTANVANTTTIVDAASTAYGSDGYVVLTAHVTANSPSTAVVNEGSVTFTILSDGTTVAVYTSGMVSNGTVTDPVDLTGTNAGVYSIIAVYNPAATNPDFQSSSSATSGQLTIAQAPLAVTADDASKFYGQATPALSGTLTGVVDGDGITASYSTSATQYSDVGDYAITPTINDPYDKLSNYTLSANNGTLTVAQYAFSYTIQSDSQSYGAPANLAADLGSTIATGVNGEDLAIAYASTGDTAAADVGGYAITGTLSDDTGRTSDYRVTLTNGTLTVNQAALIITANNVGKTYGQTVTFAGTAFSEVGLVTANGDTITGVTEGSNGATASATVAGSPYAIVTSGAVGTGLDNYAISYVYGSLTVNKAPLTITANNASKSYGQTVTFAGTAFSEVGLVTANGDTITGVTESSNGATTSATVASSPYAIAADGAVGTGLGNYAISYVNGNLTVNKAPLTVTANNVSKFYGQTVTFASMAFSEVGLLTANGDAITGVTESSNGAAASATVASSPYAIVASGAVGTGLGNYAISYVYGSLTVNKAPLTVTANNVSKTYGQTVTFAGTAFSETGLVAANGDAIMGVTESSNGVTASATVAGSPYAIVISGAVGTGLDNYMISYANGNLTVSKASLTVIANNASKTYGQTVTFTGTEYNTSGLVNGDTVTGVTLTSAGAVATATVAGSPYTIVPSGAVGTGLGNYAISYTNGSLTMNQAGTQTAVSSSLSPATFGQSVTLTATVSGGAASNPTGNVTFSIDGVTQTPVKITANDQATLPLSSLSAGTHTIVAAYVGDTNFSSSNSNSLTETIVGPASLSQSTITMSPSPIAAGGTAAVTLTARDALGRQELGGGLKVAFGWGTGSASGTYSTVTDNGNGTYTATFTGTKAGSNTITATIGSQKITSTLPIVTVVGAVSLSKSTITVSAAQVTSDNAATVTLTARDSVGHQELSGGLVVSFGWGSGTASGSFGAVTDNGNGTYTATLTGVKAGSNTIAATIDGQKVTAATPTVTVVPGAISLSKSTITVSAAQVTSSNSVTVTLVARDGNGNQELGGGLAVSFGLGSGIAGGAFGTVTDHKNGTYTAAFTRTTAGSNTITATIGGQGVTSTPPTVTVVPGPVSLSHSTITTSASQVTSDSSVTVTLVARDASGNQEISGGLAVKFTLGSGTAGGTFSTVTDHKNGTYTATLTGTKAGSNAIIATIGGHAVTSTPPTVTVVPGTVSLSKSTLTLSASQVISGNSASVTLVARDSTGNQEFGGGLTVAFGLGTGSASGTISAVTDNGNGTYTATITGTKAGSNTITATIGGQKITSTAPTVTVVPGAVSLSQSTITVSASQVTSGGTATVTLVARDANGNQEPSGGLKVALGLGTGSASGTLGTVTDHKNGTYTATFTATTAGSNTITATIGGQSVTSTPPTVTVVAGPASVSKSTVTVSASQFTSGNSTTVTLVVRDANRNQELSGGLKVDFGLSTGSASGIFSVVTDNGNGTYTATFTATKAGSNTIAATINGQKVSSTPPTVTVTPSVSSMVAQDAALMAVLADLDGSVNDTGSKLTILR